MTGFKLPESVLVVIYTESGQVLLLERTDVQGYWQSVTGSRDSHEEPLWETARRELAEETGLQATPSTLLDWGEERVYEIFPHWRHRYASGVTHNRERSFGFELPSPVPVTLSPREHSRYLWLPWREAVAHCFSGTNQEALRALALRHAWV